MINFQAPYNRTDFIDFLTDFLPDDFVNQEIKIEIDANNDFVPKYATSTIQLGTCKSLELDIYEISHTSTHDARVGIAQDAFKLMLHKSYNNRALVIFQQEGSKQYRFSLLQIEAEQKEHSTRIKYSYSNPRRYSYLLGEDAKIKTPDQILLKSKKVDYKLKPKDGDLFKDLQERFSVEVLTKQFYKELSNWYFWAIKKVSFPNDINDDEDNQKYNPENVIRLITRLIFVWFLKQKDLIQSELFDENKLSEILVDFDSQSEEQNSYYRAILQNLFFATLNQEIDKRGFAENKSFNENKGRYNIKNLYRFENEFKNSDTKSIMKLFSSIPFLNGGLFECLDGKIKNGKTYYWDGFSRSSKRQASVPNNLFFSKDDKIDLSKEYNDPKMSVVKVSGIIEILSKYNFTVEENTPAEIEVALDPELLGKVFENLLGAFNPETQETARKQTGSFYTPREIVTYMVNESLLAYYQTHVADIEEETLRIIFGYEDKEFSIDETQREELIKATFNCKILDPACGSGAFPMGILQQMVHVLGKLDPDNRYWYNIILEETTKDFGTVESEKDNEDKDELLKEIDKTFELNINYPDYTRKLYLIENCIYGVDIQTIAVQISKLRFFISLICEQNRTNDAKNNFGIRPLPNLETKFVAANTLIGIEKNEEDMEYINDDHIKKLVDKLQNIRHRQFSVTNSSKKRKLREKDEIIRHDIVNEVARLYKLHADEHLERYKKELFSSQKELELLNKMPDEFRITSQTDLFGNKKDTHFNFTESKRKELTPRIKLLEKKINDGSDYSRLNSVVKLAEQLTSWNPYDQNESSTFFDPEWMFGMTKENAPFKPAETGYFDITLGNPPYGYRTVLTKEDKDFFRKIKQIEFRSGDSAELFVKIVFDNLVKERGVLSFIIPKKSLYGDSWEDTRLNYWKKYNLRFILDTGKSFENVLLEASVFGLYKSKDERKKVTISFYSRSGIHTIGQFPIEKLFAVNDTLQIYKAQYQAIIEKIDKVKFNEKVVEGKLGLAIGTDFYSDTETDYKLLKGIDIERWNVRSYRFLRNKDKLNWENAKQFLRPKVIVQRLVAHIENPVPHLKITACYDNEGIIITNTLMSFDIDKRIDEKFWLGYLNSKFVSWYAYNFIYARAIRGMDFYNFYIQQIPIPSISFQQQLPIISLVNEIMEVKQTDPQANTSILEHKIDCIVYKLYSLTCDEVKIIDPKFGSSEKEYDEFKV